MRLSLAQTALALALGLVLNADSARADGRGVIAVGEGTGLRVDILAAPNPLRVGTTMWSVQVRNADAKIVLDADVMLEFWPAGKSEGEGKPDGRTRSTHDAAVIRVFAVNRKSENRLAYTALAELPTAGRWRGQARVQHADSIFDLALRFDVGPKAAPAAEHWGAFGLPAVSLLLFGLHQWRVHGARGPDMR